MRLTGTCWSSEVGPPFSQPLAPVKGAAAGRGRTVSCGDEPIPAHERRGNPSSNRSCGGSLREGSLSSTDVLFITNANTPSVVDGDHIAQSKEDFIVFSGSPNGQSPRRRTDHEPPARPQMTGSCHSTANPALGSTLQQEAIEVLPISQLPVSSSRGQQPRASSSSSTSHHEHPLRPLTPMRTELNQAAAAKQEAPTRHNNNNNNNNNNDENNQQHKEIWILHRDLHENNNNTKY